MNVLAADAAAAAKLEIVELSAALQHELAGVAPHLAGVANPVDLGADAPPATIGRPSAHLPPQARLTPW